MKVKTRDLIGPALDWAVAKCKGNKYGEVCFYIGTNYKSVYETEGLKQIGVNFAPSTDPSQGWPIIDKEKIGTDYDGDTGVWSAYHPGIRPKRRWWCRGSTGLVAAMRCFVVARAGEEIDIPEELLK